MIRRAAAFGDGRVDFLFNNAGAGLSGNFDEQSNEDWEQAFALNFYGALDGIRAVLPIMRAQGGGHIVNIISGIAFAPMAYQTRYAATKAALNGLTLALRYELWDENIRVTSATPGTTATPIWHGKTLPKPKLPSNRRRPSSGGRGEPAAGSRGRARCRGREDVLRSRSRRSGGRVPAGCRRKRRQSDWVV